MDIKKNILVSVIVPVYNVSKYLRRCLDSLVFQTLQEIEIIVVNDCSPDPVDREIMEEYAKKYSQKFKVVYHSKNSGLGAARNTGINNARGKYITFVDSDDFVDFSLCEILYRAASLEKADISLCNFYSCNMETGTINKVLRVDYLDESKLVKYSFSACSLLIKKQLIIENDLLFPEMVINEDVCTIPLWLALSRKVISLSHERPLYYYLTKRVDSITSNSFHSLINPIFDAYQRMYKNATKKCPDKISKICEVIITDICSGRLHKICNYAEFRLFALRMKDLISLIEQDLDVNKYNYSDKKLLNYFRYIDENIISESLYYDFLAQFKAYSLSSWSKNELQVFFSVRVADTVCVWGCGLLGNEIFVKLGELGIKCCATDINPKLHGKVMPNGSVVELWEKLKGRIKTVIVGVSHGYSEIRGLLDESVEIFAVNG